MLLEAGEPPQNPVLLQARLAALTSILETQTSAVEQLRVERDAFRGERDTANAEVETLQLIINLPPRHLKSLMASIAFPAWCLGHDPSAQILCVSYAQDLADKLAAIAAASSSARGRGGSFQPACPLIARRCRSSSPPVRAIGWPLRPVGC
jgi:hypothetical protein